MGERDGRPVRRGDAALWRSLEEARDGPLAPLAQAAEQAVRGGHDRRRVLQLMAASLGLAGLAACRPPPADQVVPGVRGHEGREPGERQVYATSLTLEGYGRGVLASCLMGRPLKLDGNPAHPATLGGSDPFIQAEILTLYDPARSGAIREAGQRSSLARLRQALALERARLAASGGRGLAIVTEPTTSPGLLALIGEVQARLPEARWHAPDPLGVSAAADGARAAFGRPLDQVLALHEADVILDLEADLLGPGPSQPVHARGFASRRDPDQDRAMSRLYALATSPGLTDATADHRAALRPREIEGFVRALLHRLGLGPEARAPAVPWFERLARDLGAHRGRVLVAAGRGQSAFVHAAAHALNHHLGAIGRAVRLIEPVRAGGQAEAGYGTLARDLEAGTVETLLVLGANPAYHAPAALDLPALLGRARLSLHLGLYEDETAALCAWHVPLAHELESWGDARAPDGTLGLRQPLIRPLQAGLTAETVLRLLLDDAADDDYERLRAFWRSRLGGEEGFEAAWRDALRTGVARDTAYPAELPALRPDWMTVPGLPEAAEGLEVVFRPDPTVWDGRFAGNAWLQELPKPLTKLTWDNAALLAPTTAAALGVANGDVVHLARAGREVEAPVWVTPGHAEGCLTLPLGYGRSRAGPVGTGLGFAAGHLRPSGAPWHAGDVSLSPTGRRVRLAATQTHHRLDGRDIVRHGRLADYVTDPGFLGDPDHEPPPSLFPEPERPGHAWGMVIDLGACIGCNACVTACQAENNTAVVGKDEVLRGRELHWLRIDRYYEGPPETPQTHLQPVLCMQCEQAPCEVVCPVNATVHSSEGLNDMVYSRCIGTRFCSNNCPYKVRRFNWFNYAGGELARPPPANNPDVTVRARGVMEKCTYCTQRISAARIAARREGRAIADGEVRTACQDACPTRAITFGDLRDLDSAVAARRASPRNYALLGRLGTRPRTTYLAKIANPAGDEA